MIACRSDPPSIRTSAPNGYGPLSLSLAYRNLIVTFWCDKGTTSNGIPYDGGPKSGCSRVEPAWLARFHVALFGWIGSFRTSMFQTLFAGKTRHDVPGTSAAFATG